MAGDWRSSCRLVRLGRHRQTPTTFLIQGFTIYGARWAGDGGRRRCRPAAASPSPMSHRRRASWRYCLLVASVPLAALPWLHTRFAVIAAAFRRGHRRASGRRPTASTGRSARGWRTRLAAFAAIPAVASALCWFAFFRTVIYGTPNPTAPYGNASCPAETTFRHLRARRKPRRAALRRPVRPADVLARSHRRRRGLAAACRWGLAACRPRGAGRDGAASRRRDDLLDVVGRRVRRRPARFFAAMPRVLALPLATAWTKGDAMRRAALVALVGISLGFAVGRHRRRTRRLAWNIRDAESRLLGWLGPVVNLRRAWPSFFWTLAPDFSFTNLGSEWIFAGHVALFVGIFVRCGSASGLPCAVSAGRGSARPIRSEPAH